MAIKSAALLLTDLKTQNQEIYFMSDSQATIKSLENHIISSKTVLDTANLLNTLGDSNKVYIKWIPGHRGYDGNEIADQLAKNGANIQIDKSAKPPIPQAVLRLKIIEYYDKIRLTRWKNTPLSDQSKTLLNAILTAADYNLNKVSDIITTLNIEDIKILTKIITGKNCLNYHLENIGYEITKDCNYCSPEDHLKIHLVDYEEETASHILCECPAFSKLRQELYGTTKLDINENEATFKNKPQKKL